jgi:hypothetical protein
VDVLRETKPYKGGGNRLWDLNAIDVRNKHEVLTLLTGTFKKLTFGFPANVTIDGERGDTVRFTVNPTSAFYPLKDGTVVVTLEIVAADGTDVNMEYQFTTDVAFGEGEILEGEPVVETLHEFAQLVHGIADAFLTAGLLR